MSRWKDPIGLLTVVAVLSLLMLCSVLWNLSQQRDIWNIDRKVWLLRTLNPGRTRNEIVREMGTPQKEESLLDEKGVRHTVLEYPSSGHFPEWTEDIMLVLSVDGRLEAIFFTDDPVERKLYDERTGSGR